MQSLLTTKTRLALSTLTLALCGTAAVAQNGGVVTADADTSSKRLDTIEVTGQVLYSDQVNALRAPTPIIDVPQSLSIITADVIAKRGFEAIGDIVAYIPGLNNSQGEGHRDAVVFRGVRSTADFFVDGVRDDVQYYRPLYNLEQVEILRGPNALLFGRGGTGGIINRVSKKAKINEKFIGISAGLDSFGGYDFSIDANKAFNDTTAGRVNAYYESLENHRDFFEGTNFGFNPTVRFGLTPKTDLDLSYEYLNHDRFIDRGIPTGSDGRPVEALKDIVFGDPELNTTAFEAHVLRANIQHRFAENIKGNLMLAYGDYDKLYQNFYASDYDAANNRVELDGYVDTTQRKRLTLAGNLVGAFNTGRIGHTVIIGAEILDTQNDNDRFNSVFSTSAEDVANNVSGARTDQAWFAISRPLNLRNGVGVVADGRTTTLAFSNVNDRNESEVSVLSLYVQDQIDVSPKLDILLGARFDRFEQSTNNLKDLANPVSVSRTDEEISPRLGLIYKPMEHISLYGSYSESFLPASGGQYASTGSLSPDTFKQSELGVKWDFADALSLTAAYFNNSEDATQRNPDTEEEFEERGLDVKGFEVQIQGDITDRLFVTGGYSYLDGETDNGAEIPRELPENMLSFWGSYQVNDVFGLGLGATYQSESFITDFDIGMAGAHPNLPAFTRIDAAATFDYSDAIRFQLNIENLTDETYFPTAHSTHQATVGEPLNISLGVKGKF